MGLPQPMPIPNPRLKPGLNPQPGLKKGSYMPIPKGLIPIMPIPKGLNPKLNAEFPQPELKFETLKLL